MTSCGRDVADPSRRAHRPARRRAGRAAGRPRSTTRSPRRSWSCRRKGVERWLTQRLSHRLGVGAARRRRRLRRGAVPQPALAGRAADRHRARRPVGPRPAGVAAARRHRRRRSTSRGARRSPPTSATASTASEAELRRTGATPSPGGWPGCSRRTPCSGPACSPTGARAATPTAPAGRSTDDLRWQPELWRRLRRRGRRAAAGRAARRDARRGSAPAAPASTCRDRLSMFGHTRLPVTELELLRAVGEVREVHLWLPQASPALWDELADAVAAGPVAAVDDARPARGPPPAAVVARPRRPRAAADAGCVRWSRPTTLDRRSRRRRRRPALLGWLQADLRANAEPRGRRGGAGSPTGRQVGAGARLPRRRPARSRCCARSWSACSQDDPTLEPRDILVMCPDIEAYAPLFSAGFGLGRRRRRTRRRTRPTGCGCGWPTAALPAPTRCSPSPARWSSSPAAG